MKRWLWIVSVCVFLGSPANAATLDSVQGKVFINRGDGFKPVSGPAAAEVGHSVMAGPDGRAKVIYPDGCAVNVRPGTIVAVGKQSPCRAKYALGGGAFDYDTGFGRQILPFVAAAAIGWGVYCAVEWCEDDDGGRRRRAEGPVSP